MYKHQYPIFNWSQSSTSKYLKFLRKGLRDIQSAIVPIKSIIDFLGQFHLQMDDPRNRWNVVRLRWRGLEIARSH